MLRKTHLKSYRNIKIEKDLIKDKSLSYMELAIIFKLLTILDNFNPSYNNMAKILHTSNKSIRTACDKLRQKGYLKIIITPMRQPNIWMLSQTREFLNDNQEQEESAK